MSVINMEAFKAAKEKKEKALQYARTYGVDINEVYAHMEEVEANTTTITKVITEAEALEALGDDYITASDMVKYGLLEEQAIDTLTDNVSTRLEEGNYDILEIGLEEYAKQKGINIIPFDPNVPY